jgi:hypothetical protein
LGDSGAADASASAAEFFKRQPALFYRGRQSKALRRLEQQQSWEKLPEWIWNPPAGTLARLEKKASRYTKVYRDADSSAACTKAKRSKRHCR